MLTSNDSNLQTQCNKDGMESLAQCFSSLLRRYYVREKIKLFQYYINARLGAGLLMSENLPKRIQGIKMVSDHIRSARTSASGKQTSDVVEDLIKLDVFKSIFDTKRFHL